MSIIPIEVAIAHLRAEPEDQPDIQIKLNAAEKRAMAYLQRRFYATLADLNNAKAGIAQALIDSRKSYEEAKEQSNDFNNHEDKDIALNHAKDTFNETRREIEMIANGMVITDDVLIGCLLILGDIYENRGDYENQETVNLILIPEGSRVWLAPYRINLGV